ncbi:hypothetical protein PRBEI_2001870300 [Prionailurus iriomotensis]
MVSRGQSVALDYPEAMHQHFEKQCLQEREIEPMDVCSG